VATSSPFCPPARRGAKTIPDGDTKSKLKAWLSKARVAGSNQPKCGWGHQCPYRSRQQLSNTSKTLAAAIVLVLLIAANVVVRRHYLRSTRTPSAGKESVPPKEAKEEPPSKTPCEFQDIDEVQIAGYRFVARREPAVGQLTVYRNRKRLVRLAGARFYLPSCGTDPGIEDKAFHVGVREYLVLGARELDGSIHGMWHVMQMAPRFRYIQGIEARPTTYCPLFVLSESDVSLVVTDTTMCGFDSDTEDCRLDFTIWYRFSRGEFRPDYSTDGTSTDWEFVRLMANSTYIAAAPAGKIAPVGFWEMILELISEGRADAATSYIDSVWSGDLAGRKTAMKAFMDRLRTSRHYRGLLRMNRGRMPH
jgi:hypothetical protein